MVWGLAVNRIDHDFLGIDLLNGFKPRTNKVLVGVVYIDSVFCFPFHEHGLNNDMAIEKFQTINDFGYIIRGFQWAIYKTDIVHIDRIDL